MGNFYVTIYVLKYGMMKTQCTRKPKQDEIKFKDE